MKIAFHYVLIAMLMFGHNDPTHPKGKKYTESELKGHRDDWYAKVKNTDAKVERTTKDAVAFLPTGRGI